MILNTSIPCFQFGDEHEFRVAGERVRVSEGGVHVIWYCKGVNNGMNNGMG